MPSKQKKIIGLVEVVRVFGTRGSTAKKALFDTGATSTSIDVRLAAKVGIGPIVGIKRVVSASHPTGKVRPVAEAVIRIRGRRIKIKANIEDRSGLRYKVLVGRDVIHNNFMIDPSRTHSSNKLRDETEHDREEQHL